MQHGQKRGEVDGCAPEYTSPSAYSMRPCPSRLLALKSPAATRECWIGREVGSGGRGRVCACVHMPVWIARDALSVSVPPPAPLPLVLDALSAPLALARAAERIGRRRHRDAHAFDERVVQPEHHLAVAGRAARELRALGVGEQEARALDARPGAALLRRRLLHRGRRRAADLHQLGRQLPQRRGHLRKERHARQHLAARARLQHAPASLPVRPLVVPAARGRRWPTHARAVRGVGWRGVGAPEEGTGAGGRRRRARGRVILLGSERTRGARRR